ncbi:MAG: hypothetical protein SFZ03_04615 [Candidatus Melainabacteria bacterium]|nr:hypothetical protein [Candidatus Melainabacteria bacterium]
MTQMISLGVLPVAVSPYRPKAQCLLTPASSSGGLSTDVFQRFGASPPSPEGNEAAFPTGRNHSPAGAPIPWLRYDQALAEEMAFFSQSDREVQAETNRHYARMQQEGVFQPTASTLLNEQDLEIGRLTRASGIVLDVLHALYAPQRLSSATGSDDSPVAVATAAAMPSPAAQWLVQPQQTKESAATDDETSKLQRAYQQLMKTLDQTLETLGQPSAQEASSRTPDDTSSLAVSWQQLKQDLLQAYAQAAGWSETERYGRFAETALAQQVIQPLEDTAHDYLGLLQKTSPQYREMTLDALPVAEIRKAVFFKQAQHMLKDVGKMAAQAYAVSEMDPLDRQAYVHQLLASSAAVLQSEAVTTPIRQENGTLSQVRTALDEQASALRTPADSSDDAAFSLAKLLQQRTNTLIAQSLEQVAQQLANAPEDATQWQELVLQQLDSVQRELGLHTDYDLHPAHRQAQNQAVEERMSQPGGAVDDVWAQLRALGIQLPEDPET